MEITIIPDKACTGKLITLDINGLGAVDVRQPLSFTTFVATAPSRDGFLYANTPCRLMYHKNYVSGGIWLMADKQKTSAQDLYGSVPVANGGTGASKAEDALNNLGGVAKAGGTMEGELKAQNNTAYTTGQMRNIFLVADGDSIPTTQNGDVVLIYTP